MKPYDVAPLLRRILGTVTEVSDVLFSPGYAPMVLAAGLLRDVPIPEFDRLNPFQTEMLALSLLRNDNHAMATFLKTGAGDTIYVLENLSRFRVNIFRQRGSLVVVMRIVPTVLPTFESLNLPAALRDIVHVRNGLVLVTGPAGCGKSSTLAAILNLMSAQYSYHVLTIEDPIEYLFPAGRSMVHQRQIGADADSFNEAFRAALRQRPQVIMVSELRDQETLEIAMEAVETGHLVFSTMPSSNVAACVERIVTMYPRDREAYIRTRFSQTIRYIISQRLLPLISGTGRVGAFEILKSNDTVRELILQHDSVSASLETAMEGGRGEGMQTLEAALAELVKNRTVSEEIALHYANRSDKLTALLKGEAEDKHKDTRQLMDLEADVESIPVMELDDIG